MKTSKIIFILILVVCLFPGVNTPMALLIGILFTQIFDFPFSVQKKSWIKYLLQLSVVGLGFGVNAIQAMDAGKKGMVITMGSILGTLILGWFFGKILKVDKKTSFLISTGTSICGGSAIAAISPIIEPEDHQISAAMGTIFILNASALFIFPWVGHFLHLTQLQFGWWSAIAIHDTSSVVGAASHFGNLALQTATTLKLVRALWIIPVSLVTAVCIRKNSKKIQIPYFILFFLIAVMMHSLIPGISAISLAITEISKIGLKITIFLIGTDLSLTMIRKVGLKSLLQGMMLWIMIAGFSLIIIINTIA